MLDCLRKKKLIFLLLSLFLLTPFIFSEKCLAETLPGNTLTGQSIGYRTWYVDDDCQQYPNADFNNISDALYYAGNGDKIVVFPGTYNENIEITKSVILKHAEGYGAASTIIKAADANKHAVTIKADGVILKGFTTTGATGENKGGVYLAEGANNCLISENISTGNYSGFGFYKCYGNILTRNTIENNTYGLGLTEGKSGSCSVEQTVDQSCAAYGETSGGKMSLLTTYRNFRDQGLKQEYVDEYYQFNPLLCRIFLARPDLAVQQYKIIKKYAPAVQYALNSNNGNEIRLQANELEGIRTFVINLKEEVQKYPDKSAQLTALLDQFLEQLDSCTDKGVAEVLRASIYFDPEKQTNNQSSQRTGQILLPGQANGNYLYLNHIGYSKKDTIYADDWANNFQSPYKIVYKYNNKTYANYLGNYYTNYQGSDTGDDGIGDTGYEIKGTSNSYDHYPLIVKPDNYELQYVALFPSTLSGKTPLTVDFTAKSPVVAEEYQWDFNSDGTIDKITTSNKVTHQYTSTGIYNVMVTAKIRDGLVSSNIVTITVSDTAYVNGEIRFVPFYPSENEPSEVMTGGKGFRYYRVLDKNGKPLSKVSFNYRWSDDYNIFTGTTDEAGFVRINTGWVFADKEYQVVVLNEDGSTKADAKNPPHFYVKINPREVDQKWSLLVGAKGSVGVGGPSAKLGPLQFETAKLAVEGGRSTELAIKYGIESEKNNVTIENGLELSIGSVGKLGLFGSTWGDKGGPAKFNVGVSGNLKSKAKCGVGAEFEDFMNTAKPDHNQQVLEASLMFLETGLVSQPVVPVGADYLINKVMELLDMGSNRTLLTKTAAGFGASVGASLALDNPLGKAEINLANLGAKGVLSYQTTESLQNNPKKITSTCELTGEKNVDLLSVNFNKNFGSAVDGERPAFSLDLIPSGYERKYEAKDSVEVEKENGVVKKLIIQKALPSGDVVYGPLEPKLEKTYQVEIDNTIALNKLINSEPIGSIIKGTNFGITSNTIDKSLDAVFQLDPEEAKWSRETVESIIINVPFDLELGLGLDLGLGIEMEGKSSLGFTEQGGTLSAKYGQLKLEEYENDLEISRRRSDLLDLVKVFKDTLSEIVKSGLETVCAAPVNGVKHAYASVKGSVENTTVYLTRLVPMKSSYQILALPSSFDRTKAQVQQAYEATTIGDVYIVNLTDSNNNPIKDYSTNPLELTINYSDALLAAAGYSTEIASRLAIYRWDGSAGYYIHQPSVVDEAGKAVMAMITKPGQYILAIDDTKPAVTDFKVSNNMATPTFTAIVSDDFSGINKESFIFKIDGTPLVTCDNLDDYYNQQTGLFKYIVTDPLTAGQHTAEISVKDSAGNEADTNVLTFTVNNIPPVIEHNPVTKHPAGRDLTINATITDDTQVKEACLFYKPEHSAESYQPVSMDADTGAGYTAILPGRDLAHNALYYIMAQDIDGNESVLPPALIKVTGTDRPYVLSTTPSLGGIVPTDNASIILTFSESVLPGPDFGNITCKTGDTLVEVYYNTNGNVLSIAPVDSLAVGTDYTVVVPAGAVQNINGNSMPSDYLFSFTTKQSDSDSEVALPTKTIHDRKKVWTIRFNIPVYRQTINSDNIYVTDAAGSPVNVTVSAGEDGKSVIVEPPQAGYTEGQSYTLHIKKSVNSISGASLKNSLKMQFTVAATHIAEFTVGSNTYKTDGLIQTMDAAPYLSNGNTFVPVKYVALGLGVDQSNVIWDSTNQSLTIIKGDRVIKATAGENILLVNGVEVNMDVCPEMTGGQLMMPIQWVAQALEATVDRNPLTQTITFESATNNKSVHSAKFTVGSHSYTADGQDYNMDVAPYICNDRTFVPVKYVALALGVAHSNILWDDTEQSLTLIFGDRVVQIRVGSNVLLINGLATVMDVAPETVNDQVMIPIRYAAEALSANVSWDAETQEIIFEKEA